MEAHLRLWDDGVLVVMMFGGEGRGREFHGSEILILNSKMQCLFKSDFVLNNS